MHRQTCLCLGIRMILFSSCRKLFGKFFPAAGGKIFFMSWIEIRFYLFIWIIYFLAELKEVVGAEEIDGWDLDAEEQLTEDDLLQLEIENDEADKPKVRINSFSATVTYIDLKLGLGFLASDFQLSSQTFSVNFHDRRVNAKINHILERALRIAYHDRTSGFDELFITDHSVSIDQRNLQLLVTEIYRTRMNLNPCFMKEIFAEREMIF